METSPEIKQPSALGEDSLAPSTLPVNMNDGRSNRGWHGLAGLLPSWLATGWLASKASWFWQHNPDLQFGWIVLLLSAYLAWEAWETKPRYQFQWDAGVWAIAGLGFAVLFLTQLFQAAYGLTPSSMSGLGLGVLLVVSANVAAVFGSAGVWHFAFPFCFLFIALPVPSAIYSPIVIGLQSMVASINTEILNLAGIPATKSGSLIHLSNGTVGIDEACSGVRSLQSTLMATLFIGYLTLKRTSLRVILLLAGVVLAITGNLIRSLFLSLVANAQGIKSIEQYHDTAGWSVLGFTVAGVAVLAWLFNKLDQSLGRLVPPAISSSPTADKEIEAGKAGS